MVARRQMNPTIEKLGHASCGKTVPSSPSPGATRGLAIDQHRTLDTVFPWSLGVVV